MGHIYLIYNFHGLFNIDIFFYLELKFDMIFNELFEKECLKCSSLSFFCRVMAADQIIKFATPTDSLLNQVIKALSGLFFLYCKAIEFIVVFLGLQLLTK